MLLRAILAIALAVTFQVAQPATTEASCAWNSTSTPPSSIRVLKVKTGRIVTVDFKQYVRVVVATEWRSTYLPKAVLYAGAVASKQYAWHRSMNPRWSNGRCYHVKDSTVDQLYRPGKYEILDRHRRAVADTWGWTMWRDGRFVLTQYARGEDVGCAKDAGRRLYVRSSKKCANRYDWGYGRILRVYYSSVPKVL